MARVLVVDDDVGVRDLTREVLCAAGHSVATVAGGADAVAAVGRESFDLVLLDVLMPGMDGWQTLCALRAAVPMPPVAMYSIKCDPRDRVRALEGGAIEYITKPFALDEFIERVRSILARDGASGAVTPPVTLG